MSPHSTRQDLEAHRETLNQRLEHQDPNPEARFHPEAVPGEGDAPSGEAQQRIT